MKDIENPTRRGFLTTVSAVGLNLAIEAIPALAQPASERPKEGDLLVSIESESTNALEPGEIPLGGPPLLAWPMDAADKTVRKDSRLNKVLLLRLDPSTHAGGEVNVWAAEQQTLECSCHYSHYNPREGASVIDGPAPRALAALPLKIVDGKLAVAKPFTGRVGIVPS